MDTLSRCSIVLVITVFEILTLALTTPVWNSQTTGIGRNIRHLPCVSRRSGEAGVCMFAISCAKANGTHLGTCIDRFYFGSCCKLSQDDAVAEPLDSNHIFEESPGFSTENYHISTYQSVDTVKNTSKDPVIPSTTTPRTTQGTTTPKPAKTPTSTSKPSISVSSTVYTHKPVTGKPVVTKPYTQSGNVKPRPTNKPQTSGKPPNVSKPSGNTSSQKPPVKPPVKPVVTPNKQKPSNTTSHTKPPSKPISQKPLNGTITKPTKPLVTKRPTTTNTAKPSYTQPHRNTTTKPASKPPSKPPVKPGSGTPKPQTRPPLKPVPVVTSAPPTDPNYVKVPVMTVPTTDKPPVESSTISNEVAQKPETNLVTNTTLFEETSNVLSEASPSPTTSSTLLVTWTTVDEVPVPPLPKPGSTPSSDTPKNETKPTPAATTQSSQTWVQVSVSTPASTTVNEGSPRPGSTTPQPTTSSPKPTKPAKPTKPTKPTTTPTTTTTTSTSTSTTTVATTVTTQPTTTTSALPPAETTTEGQAPVKNTTTPDLTNEINTSHLNMSDYLDVCGRRLFPQSRIVGGDKATFGKWPWQISLRQWRTSTYLHKCGAALLNENWAITAAHCVENVAPSDLLLRLGEHDLSVEDEPYGFQERRVQIVASHPQFDPRTFEYDLALLRFYEPVTFQPNIIPVCVPQDDTNFVGSTAYVTGWGRLYEDGPLPSVLQEVSVPVINNTVCETMYRAAGYIEHIPEIFICAGWKKGGFDSCEGDSGGPMVIQRPDKRWLLAGIISWGIGCAEPNQPGVYTRISEFRGWINQILQF